jgi:secreted PhoX family phosphatase
LFLTIVGYCFLIVAEDGGFPGLFEYDGNNSKALLENQVTNSEEVTGVDFSPDRKFMYVCMQHEGRLFEVRRLDGLPFEGRRILRKV